MATRKQRSGQASLRDREYSDRAGGVHHHTKVYMEQHGGTSGRGKGQGQARGQSKAGAPSAGKSGRRSGARSARGPAGSTQGAEKGLQDLFVETLKDVYSAEKQMLRAMAAIGKSAQSPELRQALDTHRQETEGQVDRLEQVFELAGSPARAKPCEAIKGLIEEAKEVASEFKGTDALDAGLLASVQAVEHYEISRYGTLVAWARQLGLQPAAKLLSQTLDEEKRTDKILTQVAEANANRQAETA
jgi:ferritin-like metal-binding protein YciE